MLIRKRFWCYLVSAILAVAICARVMERLTVSKLAHDTTQPRRSEPHWIYHDQDQHNSSFKDTLRRVFPENQTIILAMVDSPFVDMAVNFYITSLKRFDIQNFLFVGLSRKTCESMTFVHGLPCYPYTNIDTDGKASSFQTKKFNQKMNVRTDMILDALSLGYSVVHTDLDMVFLQNPLPDLARVNTDVSTMWDKVVYNAGFLIVKPTAAGIWIYKRVRQITQQSLKIDDQKALNRAFRECKKLDPPCAVSALPTKSYLCGYAYFEVAKRYFGDPQPCPECMVVHNNWIVTKEAKVYRFRENLLWLYDDGAYYSSTNRRYLTYNNPIVFGDQETSLKQETLALQNALRISRVLNRVVILPQFHCLYNRKSSKELCPLNSLYAVDMFDKQFDGDYRESTFLRHSMVPGSVKSSRSTVYAIGNNSVADTNSSTVHSTKMKHLSAHSPGNNTMVVKFPGNKQGASPAELRSWFGGDTSCVLRFDNLYGFIHGKDNSAEFAKFQQKLDSAFKVSTYRQYK